MGYGYSRAESNYAGYDDINSTKFANSQKPLTKNRYEPNKPSSMLDSKHEPRETYSSFGADKGLGVVIQEGRTGGGYAS
jgi:hypothetical protein